MHSRETCNVHRPWLTHPVPSFGQFRELRVLDASCMGVECYAGDGDGDGDGDETGKMLSGEPGKVMNPLPLQLPTYVR